MKKQAIFITGPTAAGKTSVVIDLYKKLPIEIISVDSSMIYKEMDIGTGKPTKQELQIAPHHLIDIIYPNEIYSVAKFCTDALNIMDNAINNNKLPVLVGGTMMYFKALQQGLSILPSANEELRATISTELQQYGPEYLHKKLQLLDEDAAKRIHPNDPQRLQRALEIVLLTGKTSKELFSTNEYKLEDWDIKIIAIAPQVRNILHERIKDRFYKMLSLGLVDEVKYLQKKYHLTQFMPSMRSIGYRQVLEYLNNAYNYDTMVEKAIIATRQLAKRQYTWLRSFSDLIWLDSDAVDLTEQVQNIITKN